MNEALLQQLIDAGTPPLLVAKVAAELSALATKAEAATDMLERRRSNDRQRQANHRSNNVMSRDETLVTGPTPTPSLSLPPDPQPNPTPAPGDITPARKAGPFPMPEGVDPDHWRDFLANRKRKNLSNTPTAHKRLMDDLSRWADDEWPPPRLIEHAAARGWAGIYDPREEQTNVRTRKPDGQQPGIGRTAAARNSIVARLHAQRSANQA